MTLIAEVGSTPPAAAPGPVAQTEKASSVARIVLARVGFAFSVVVLAMIMLVLLWIGLFKLFDVDPLVGKTPTDVFHYLFTATDDLPKNGIRKAVLSAADARSELMTGLGTTLVDSAIGFVTGLVLALVIAASFVLFRPLEFAFMPIAMLLRSVPLVAMAPVLLMMFSGKVAIAAIGAIVVLFPALVNIVLGLRSASPQSLDVIKVYGGTERMALIKVRIPSALPNFFAAVRISVPGAVVGAMLAEWLSGVDGLGGLLNQYGVSNKTGVWAIVVVSVVTSIVLYAISTIFESAALAKWGPNAGKNA